jgi:hypothetical protein
MTPVFETIQYFRKDLRDEPEAVVALICRPRRLGGSDRMILHGEYAGTDK